LKVQNPHPYPVDVPGGPVLATAETATVKDSVELHQAIALGVVIEVEGAQASKKGNK
jgi:hypothetical protein